MRSGHRYTRLARRSSTNCCGTQVRLYSRLLRVPTRKPYSFSVPMARHKVCWPTVQIGNPRLCGCNRAQCLTHFGLEDTIDGWWEVVLPIGAIYRNIAANRRLHSVPCLAVCGIWGMRDTVAATTDKSAAIVLHNLFQPIVDVARIQVKT